MHEEVTFENFCQAFGASVSDENILNLKEKISKNNFQYRRFNMEERDRLICSVLKKIKDFTQVGSHRNAIWDSAWKDVSDSYQVSGEMLSALHPSFVSSATNIIRLNGDYALPLSPTFEKDWFSIFREWLFHSYLKDYDSVYEFGCGSGYNLVALSEIFPEKTLYGLDWSEAAVSLIEKIRATHGIKIYGKQFDFFQPSADLVLEKNSAVMTFCALEQTGAKYKDFILWLLEQNSSIVINMEPILDFYKPDNLFDYIALSYHQHRGYLEGYLPFLEELEKEKKIQILQAKRLNFGSLYHEGYNLVIWKPL